MEANVKAPQNRASVCYQCSNCIKLIMILRRVFSAVECLWVTEAVGERR